MAHGQSEPALMVRRASVADVELLLTPCTVPPFGGVDPGDWEAVVEARRAWLRQGLASDRVRVMVALVPAPAGPEMEYPGFGPIPVASLAHDGLIPAGLLEYAPLAHAAEPVRGGGHWFIHCIWVIPPFAARRVGSELIAAALRDLRGDPGVDPEAGLAVVAYRGTKWWDFFDYMPEAFFALHGFRPVDRDGPRVLMYRPLAPGGTGAPEGGQEAPAGGGLPYLIPPRESLEGADPPAPGPAAGRTHVRFVYHSRCPAAAWVGLQLQAAARGRPDLSVESVDARNPGVLQAYGVANGVYANGRLVLHKVPSPAEVMAAAGIGRRS